jgi:hypothetical protein
MLYLTIASTLLGGFAAAPEDIAGWSFVTSKDAQSGIMTVSSPVREGATSIAFTLRPGSCTGNDCVHDRERIELKQVEYQHEGETWWYAWSFYVPTDFQLAWPVRTFLGQFHQEGGEPAMLFSLEPEGLMFETRFAPGRKPLLVPGETLKGRWHDIVMKVEWSRRDGSVSIAVDGKTMVDRRQPTMSERDVYFKFGIYRAHVSRAAKTPLPVQSVFYDRLRRALTRDQLRQ